MNRKLTDRVVHWLALITTTTCAGFLVFPATAAQAQQDDAGYEWRVDASSVQHANGNSGMPGHVAQAVGHQPISPRLIPGQPMPPILSPDQAEPQAKSSGLQPLGGPQTASALPMMPPRTMPPRTMNQPMSLQPMAVQPMANRPMPMHQGNPMMRPVQTPLAENQQALMPQPSGRSNPLSPSVHVPNTNMPLAENMPLPTQPMGVPMNTTGANGPLQPNSMPNTSLAPASNRPMGMRVSNAFAETAETDHPGVTTSPMESESYVAPAQWPMPENMVRQEGVRVAQGSGSRTPTPNTGAIVQEPVNQVQSSPSDMNLVTPGAGGVINQPESFPPIVSGSESVSTVLPPSATLPAETTMPTTLEPMPTGAPVVPPSSNLIDSGQNFVDSSNSNYFHSNPNSPVYSPNHSGTCSSCNGSGCASCGVVSSAGIKDSVGCNSCGPGGCFNQGMVDKKFGCAGTVSCARRYVIADVLYFSREDGDDFGGTTRGPMQEFDSEIGWRFTIGRRWDATAGDEWSYMGTSEIERRREINSTAGNLNANFAVAGGFGVNEVGAFFGANQQIEFQSTELHSIEYNRVKWSWDVAKMFWGMRYIYTEDFYALFSDDGTQGSLSFDARNNLFGPHIGGELFYDVGYRLSVSAGFKAGAYINLAELDTRLNNNFTNIIVREDDSTDISGSLELNFTSHYQLTTQARLRGGVDVLWLYDVTTANDNFPNVVTGSLGANGSHDDDMLFMGISGGIEIFR